MSKSRTALRSLGVLAAASGLALAGAGVASATTFDHDVDGNTVSVEFTLETTGTTDTCGAALIPPNALAEILSKLGGGDLGNAFETIDAIQGVTVLKNGNAAAVRLGEDATTRTVTATDVPSGAYMLVSVCLSDLSEPGTDLVTVGNPLDIISGLSSDGLLDTASSLLQGGDESGLGAILSSAVGGE